MPSSLRKVKGRKNKRGHKGLKSELPKQTAVFVAQKGEDMRDRKNNTELGLAVNTAWHLAVWNMLDLSWGPAHAPL